MRTLFTSVVVAALGVLPACSTSSGGGTSHGSGADASADCPEGGACGCVCPTSSDGGTCTCAGGSYPACPADAPNGLTCASAGAACVGCSQGAGFACTCDKSAPGQEAGVLGWDCAGTQHACTGGS